MLFIELNRIEKTMTDILWDDLDVGQIYKSGTIKLDKNQLIDFAQTFDPQPMHTNEEQAKDSFFGQLVGSGWHTLSSTIRLLAEAKPFGRTPLIGMEVDKVRFVKPLLPDAELQAIMEVISLRESRQKERGYVRVKVTTTANSEPILTQEWLMLMPRKKPDLGD